MESEGPGSEDGPFERLFEAQVVGGDIEERQTLARVEAMMFGAAQSRVMLDRYVLQGRIGGGGIGVVFAAHDPELDREVAIKLLLAGRAATSSASEGQARLLREAQAMAKISHPNVIAVYDVGTYDETSEEWLLDEPASRPEAKPGKPERRGVFVVMELVEGLDGKQWRQQRTPAWREVLDVYFAAGRGLLAAHAAGLVHRDFKPANVLVGNDGRVRVLDFGLARAMTPEDLGVVDGGPDTTTGNTAAAAHPALDESLTTTGGVMGTPRYMAPEQHRGETADERSDQFSFCVALYEALYEAAPFVGSDAETLGIAKEDGAVRAPPSDTAVPGRLQRVLLRGLAARPEDRYASMKELLAELDPGGSGRGRQGWLLAIAAVAVAAAGAGGIVLGSSGKDDATPSTATPTEATAAVDPRSQVGAIAFLPFVDESGDVRLDFARDGLPHLLGTEIKRSSDARVLSYYRLLERVSGPTAPLEEWRQRAGELDAQAVVHGVLRKAGDGIEVTVIVERPNGEELVRLTRTCSVEEVPATVRALGTDVLRSTGRATASQSDEEPRAFDFERNLQLAISALERDEPEAAESFLDAALAVDPKSGEAHYYMALRSSWARGRQADTQREIDAALAGTLTDAQRGLMKGFRAYVSQEFATAIDELQEVHRAHPEDRYVLYGLFESAFHGGRPALAIDAYRKMRELSPRFNLGSQHALNYYAGRGDVAGVEWANALEGNQSGRRQQWEARTLMMKGDYPAAIARLGRLSEESDAELEWSADMLIQAHALNRELSFALVLAQQRAEEDPAQGALPRYALDLARGSTEDQRNRRAAMLNAADSPPFAFERTEAWTYVVALELPVAGKDDLNQLRSTLDRLPEPPFVRDLRVAQVLLAGASGDVDAVAASLDSEFPEVESIAKAFAAERKSDLDAAVKHWSEAIDYSADGRFLPIHRWQIARLRVTLGDHDGVLAVCKDVIEPPLFYWSWATTIGPCLRWTGDAAAALGDRRAADAAYVRLAEQRASAPSDDPLHAAALAGVSASKGR
jgi:serine/threonine protein kinase